MPSIDDISNVVKSEPIKDIPVNKNVAWKDGKLRANRIAGRPEKDLAPVENAQRSQLAIYNKVSAFQDQIYENLNFYLTHKNEKLRLDVTMYLFDKLLPNAKAQELAERNVPITVNFVKAGYIPPNSDVTAPMGGDERPTPLQSISLASASEEDNNSNNGSSQTSDNEKGSILAPISNVR